MTLLWARTRWLPIVTFLVFDTLAIGIGMGVPLLAIALGLPAGWVIGGRVAAAIAEPRRILRLTLLYSTLAAAFTFTVLAMIWIPGAIGYVTSGLDVAGFGAPMILYDPLASFVGWLVLMVLVSPVLQLLMALLGVHLRLIRVLR